MRSDTAFGLYCPSCGAGNDSGSRFCRSCGAPLAVEATTAEARKVVTILFLDLAGFTALGESLDPEALRRLLTRYFDEMSAVIRRHGGRTEKFIGDAIMAVFGMPQVHEDDALRAVTAAVEMREALHELNEEFQRDWGVQILVRMGVNTGEVIAADATLGRAALVGDAVNVASRLETACEPGEILIGETTHRLVADAVTAEPLPPLELKGKQERVAPWRLIELAPRSGAARRLGSPLVGRDHESAQLEEAFRRVAETGSAELVTVMGPAGVGKSRLVAELAPGLAGRAQVLSGRCLPYGEGITFWPVVEILRGAADIGELDVSNEARGKIADLLTGPDAGLAGERLAALVGFADTTVGIQETFWAVRKLFEELARRQPLVVILNDIHWAEPTFLDLVEYLADWLDRVPVLILCLARPELLELRGNWMTGKANATLVTLRPLGDEQVNEMIENLLGGALAPEARARIAKAADGNPLFVEETLRMLVDDGLLRPVDESWTATGDLTALEIPPTIQALLGARLDRLDDEERVVIERASVIGRVFWWGAVTELSPPEQRPRVGGNLQSLTRKELVRPDHTDLSGEDAFRFTHVLVCDAAYRAIPKSARAELHERFADWLDDRVHHGIGAYEELLGYHLEQAFQSLVDLGPLDERAGALGRRAAVPLGSAGRRAFARGDMPAAVNLLSRATALSPSGDPGRTELLPDLAFALLETGEFERLQDVVTETSQAANASGDRRLLAQASILELWVRMFTDPAGWAEEAQREARRAIAAFEELRDEHGLAKAWALLGLFHLVTCEFGAAEGAWEQAATHAGAAGADRERLEALAWVPLVVWGGPTPVEEAIRRCASVLERAAGDRKAMATALYTQGKLEAMRGRFDEARRLIAAARSLLEEVALSVWAAGPFAQMAAWVELLSGDPGAAERELRASVATLREIGELAWLPTVAGILAEAVLEQGRLDEAEEFVELCEESAGADDAYSQGLARALRAKILARQGEAAEAERLGREAVAIAEETDFSFLHAFTLSSLGEALQLVGRAAEAERPLEAALGVCERKGFTVGADRIRALL